MTIAHAGRDCRSVPETMQPGDVLDGRFALDTIAGHGGMGTVFRARGLASGEIVEFKVPRLAAAPEHRPPAKRRRSR